MEVIEQLEAGAGKKCKECQFFDAPDCKRYPPVSDKRLNGFGEEYYETVFPQVEEDTWCGEFKEVENGTKRHDGRRKTKSAEVLG